jgi:hypothetical protein
MKRETPKIGPRSAGIPSPTRLSGALRAVSGGKDLLFGKSEFWIVSLCVPHCLCITV